MHQESGKRGEDIAAQYLIERGFTVIVRNYRFRRSEVDLIVQKDHLLVFVEVKARSSLDHGFPEEFVSMAQANRVIQAAEQYVEDHDWQGDIRFDIVAVQLSPTVRVHHFEDAFY